MKKISKIHFLIHPGFFEMDARLANAFDNPDWQKQDIDLLRGLFERYLEKFSNLPNHELLVALTYDYRKDLKKRLGGASSSWPSYVDVLRQLKKDLGDRVVVFSESAVTHTHDRKITLLDLQEKMQRILKGRGYEVSEDVVLEACGELINNCVEAYGEAFRRDMKTEEPLQVDTTATDAVRYRDGGLKDIVKRNKHIRYR
jgi:hypothetical protein